ncbi:MAG TPA: M43 family zinc metalloprotease [Bacteroidia bacterium]|nr:M43 family zinc metalloprotease [Bacteroidia bacterium]
MKFFTQTLFQITSIGLFSFSSIAQVKSPCSAYEANKKMEALYPNEVHQAEAQLEAETVDFAQNRSASSVIYTIPVVFHILHVYGTENISDAQIEDAMAILNRDYNKQNPDTANTVAAFQGIAANVGIQFKLAKLDPNGNCTNGIDRIYSSLTYIGDDDAKLNVWPRNKYLNVWVVKNISSGAAGYSMYPSSVQGNGGAQVDGVMILHNYVGSIGTGSASRSRALTHEVGHWLNLPHPWGNSNSPGVSSNCNIDDNVSDTPNTVGWTTCNLNGASCGSPLDNVQNFMEYSYCSTMFTNGQKTRMLAALTSNTASRSNLWTNNNLTATGVNTNTVCAPVADFYAETPQVCVNTNINFFENSNLAPATSWSWSFPGGTPATATNQNPTVLYANPGTYSVSLTITNANGSSSVTKNTYINIVPTTPDITVGNFAEGFENLTINAASNWSVNNVTGGNTWGITSNAAYTGSKSIKLSNINNTPGSIDEFVMPSMDLTQFASPRLYYKIAYASLTGTAGVDYQSNSLQVLSSVDFGKTWGVRRTYTENTLSTTADQDAAFTPTSQSQWREDNINLSLFAGYTNIQFKFRFEAGEGNNIYIDDINMNNATPLHEFESLKNNFRIAPNPAENDAVVYFSTETSANTSIKVFDVLGKIVAEYTMGNIAAGNHNIILSKDNLNSSGIYFVQLSVNDVILSKKFVLK